MLQMFGACLATTELPRGLPSTEELLMSHTRQWNKLQVSGQRPLTVQPLCQHMVSLLGRAGRRIKSSSSLFSSDLAATDHLNVKDEHYVAVREKKYLVRLGGTCKRIAINTCGKHSSQGQFIPSLCRQGDVCECPSRAAFCSGHSKI